MCNSSAFLVVRYPNVGLTVEDTTSLLARPVSGGSVWRRAAMMLSPTPVQLLLAVHKGWLPSSNIAITIDITIHSAQI